MGAQGWLLPSGLGQGLERLPGGSPILPFHITVPFYRWRNQGSWAGLGSCCPGQLAISHQSLEVMGPPTPGLPGAGLGRPEPLGGPQGLVGAPARAAGPGLGPGEGARRFHSTQPAASAPVGHSRPSRVAGGQWWDPHLRTRLQELLGRAYLGIGAPHCGCLILTHAPDPAASRRRRHWRAAGPVAGFLSAPESSSHIRRPAGQALP